jgi:hypothetical protein
MGNYTVDDVPAGWSRVVVRYRDERVVKGYNRDFLPGHGHVHVWPAVDAPLSARITVPFGELKAVFFVRDLRGDAIRVEDNTFDNDSGGRRIIVTFVDDETLTGTTMNYQSDGPGFFVVPADPKSNNERIFVVSRAVRHVQFPQS